MNDKDSRISNQLSHIIFITGGTKSGKSEFAEYLAKVEKNLSYVALSKTNPEDKEWQKKLKYIVKKAKKLENNRNYRSIKYINKEDGPLLN